MQSWLEFWNAPNKIYVSPRHQQAHYATVLAGISRFVPAGAQATVLDWGCSDALGAPQLARRCGTLLLYDAAETTRDRLRASYAGAPHIRVLDDAGLAAVAGGSVDLIVVNSVVQYLSRQQLDDALQLFHRLLVDDGKLLVGDIIAPDTPLIGHVMTFLRFAWQNGFFPAAVFGLVHNFVTPYRRLRRDAGYACYSTEQMLAVFGENGFAAEKLASNIAVSQLRSSYLARKRSSPGGSGSQASSASRAIA